jgi:hypothetical protein
MQRKQPEADLQKAVVRHLRQRATPGVVFWHTPNSSKLGGKRTKTGVPLEAIRGKALGVRAGVSDIIALRNREFFALELKAPNGRPTEAQLEFLSDIRAAGGHGCVAEGLNEALLILESWGLLRRAA